jgi:hypothetical protein
MRKGFAIILGAIFGAGYGFVLGFSVFWAAFGLRDSKPLWAGIGVAVLGSISLALWTAEAFDGDGRKGPRRHYDHYGDEL